MSTMNAPKPKGRLLKLFVKALLVAGLITGVFAIAWTYYTHLGGNYDRIQVTNLTDRSATIVWVSDKPAIGKVAVQEGRSRSPVRLKADGQIFYDDRDIARAMLATHETDRRKVKVQDYGEYYVHHITIPDLDPEHEYSFYISDGGLFTKGAVSSFRTIPALDALVTPYPMYGKVVFNYDEVPEHGFDGVVFAKPILKGREINPISAVVNSDGSYYLDLTAYRTAEGKMIDLSLPVVQSVSADMGLIGSVPSTSVDLDEIAPMSDLVVVRGRPYDTGKTEARLLGMPVRRASTVSFLDRITNLMPGARAADNCCNTPGYHTCSSDPEWVAGYNACTAKQCTACGQGNSSEQAKKEDAKKAGCNGDKWNERQCKMVGGNQGMCESGGFTRYPQDQGYCIPPGGGACTKECPPPEPPATPAPAAAAQAVERPPNICIEGELVELTDDNADQFVAHTCDANNRCITGQVCGNDDCNQCKCYGQDIDPGTMCLSNGMSRAVGVGASSTGGILYHYIVDNGSVPPYCTKSRHTKLTIKEINNRQNAFINDNLCQEALKKMNKGDNGVPVCTPSTCTGCTREVKCSKTVDGEVRRGHCGDNGKGVDVCMVDDPQGGAGGGGAAVFEVVSIITEGDQAVPVCRDDCMPGTVVSGFIDLICTYHTEIVPSGSGGTWTSTNTRCMRHIRAKPGPDTVPYCTNVDHEGAHVKQSCYCKAGWTDRIVPNPKSDICWDGVNKGCRPSDAEDKDCVHEESGDKGKCKKVTTNGYTQMKCITPGQSALPLLAPPRVATTTLEPTRPIAGLLSTVHAQIPEPPAGEPQQPDVEFIPDTTGDLGGRFKFRRPGMYCADILGANRCFDITEADTPIYLYLDLNNEDEWDGVFDTGDLSLGVVYLDDELGGFTLQYTPVVSRTADESESVGSIAVCGDGVTEGSEACDDGNTYQGDSCSADCSTFYGTTELTCNKTADCVDDRGNVPFGVGCYQGYCRSAAPSCLDEAGKPDLKKRGKACTDLFGNTAERHCSLKPDNTPGDLTDNYIWCGRDGVGFDSPVSSLDRRVRCEADVDCGPLPQTSEFENHSISCESHFCVITPDPVTIQPGETCDNPGGVCLCSTYDGELPDQVICPVSADAVVAQVGVGIPLSAMPAYDGDDDIVYIPGYPQLLTGEKCEGPYCACEELSGVFTSQGHTCEPWHKRGYGDESNKSDSAAQRNPSILRLVSPVHAESIKLSAKNGIFAVEKSGTYCTQVQNKKYCFAIPTGEREYRLYIDVNSNGEFDEGDVDLGKEFTNIEIAQESTYFEYELHSGFNLVAFPFVSDAYGQSAASMLDYLNAQYSDAFYSISEYDNDGWHVVGNRNGATYASNDFQVIPGKGYLLKTKRNVQVRLSGKSVQTPVPVYVHPGWNLLAIAGTRTPYTAQRVLNEMNEAEYEADNMSRWDVLLGRYNGLQRGEDTGQPVFYGFDYPLVDLESYFVRVQSGSGDWTPK